MKATYWSTVASSGRMVGGLLAAALIISLLFVHSPAQAAVAYPIKGIAGKCLDVQGGVAEPRNKVQLYTCNDTAAQKWEQPGDGTLRNQGLCLDVAWGGKAEKTTVWLYECNGSTAQQWSVNADGSIVSLHANLCLDDMQGITDDRNPIWIYVCNATASQQWTIVVSPPAVPVVVPVPVPAPRISEPAPRNVYYKNCSAARAAGAAPVYEGQPGYGRHLDRDGDGVGCE